MEAPRLDVALDRPSEAAAFRVKARGNAKAAKDGGEMREDMDNAKEWRAESARSAGSFEAAEDDNNGDTKDQAAKARRGKTRKPPPPEGRPDKASSSTSAMVRAQLYQLRKLRRERRASMEGQPVKAATPALPLEDIDTLAIAREARKKAATPRITTDALVNNDHFVDTGGLNVRNLETAIDASEIPSANDATRTPDAADDQAVLGPDDDAANKQDFADLDAYMSGPVEDDLEMESLASVHDTAELSEAATITQVERIDSEPEDEEVLPSPEPLSTAPTGIAANGPSSTPTEQSKSSTSGKSKEKMKKKEKKKKEKKKKSKDKNVSLRIDAHQMTEHGNEEYTDSNSYELENRSAHDTYDTYDAHATDQDTWASWEHPGHEGQTEEQHYEEQQYEEHGTTASGEAEGATFYQWDPVSGGYQTWTIHYTDSGEVYFYCEDSHESRWTDPRTDDHGYEMHDEDTYRSTEGTWDEDDGAEGYEIMDGNGDLSWTAYWHEQAEAYRQTSRSAVSSEGEAATQTGTSTGRWSAGDLDRLEQQGFLSARSTARYAVFGTVDDVGEAPTSPVPKLDLPGAESLTAWDPSTQRSTAAELHSAYHEATAAAGMGYDAAYAYYGKTPRELELEGQLRYLNARAQWLEQEAFYSKEAERAAALRAEYTARTQADMVQRARHEERRRSMIDMSLITQALGDEGTPVTAATVEGPGEYWHASDHGFGGEAQGIPEAELYADAAVYGAEQKGEEKYVDMNDL